MEEALHIHQIINGVEKENNSDALRRDETFKARNWFMNIEMEGIIIAIKNIVIEVKVKCHGKEGLTMNIMNAHLE